MLKEWQVALPPSVPAPKAGPGGQPTLVQSLGAATQPLLEGARDLLARETLKQRAEEDKQAAVGWLNQGAKLAAGAPSALVRATAAKLGQALGEPALGKLFQDKVAFFQVLRDLELDAGREFAGDPRLAGVAPAILADLETERRRLAAAQATAAQGRAIAQRVQLSRALAGYVTDVTRGLAGPELSREQLLGVYGPAEGEARWQRWQTHRAKAPAYALVRGKSPAALAETKAEYQGNRRLLEQVAAEDAAERRRDPAGYGLTWAPGFRAAYDQASDPAERAALLWEAQAAAGIPETQRSPWPAEQGWDLGQRWLAIAEGPGGARARVAFLRETLMTLPPEQRAAGLTTLERMELDATASGQLRGIVAALADDAPGDAFSFAGGRLAGLHSTRVAFEQLADLQDGPADDAGPSESDGKPSTGPQEWNFENELKALGIAPNDPAFATVPATMSKLLEGYDVAEGAFIGIPPDDAALRAVLRSLYLRTGDMRERTKAPLTDAEAQAVAAIYAIYDQQGIDPAFAAAEFPLRERAFKGLNSTLPPPKVDGKEQGEAFRDRILGWGSLDEQGKEQLLRDAATLVNEAYGLPSDYALEFASLGEGGPYGQYRVEKTQGGSGRLILDLAKFDPRDGRRAIAWLLHELVHVYQAALMRAVVKREIGADDPRYRQIELFILSQAFYATVSDPVRNVYKKYYDDPRERHSQRAYIAWERYWDAGTLTSN